MTLVTTLLALAALSSSPAPAADLQVTWTAPKSFLDGSSFVAHVEVQAPADGGTLPAYAITGSAFAVDGKPPRTVTIVTVEEAYFQCARAIVRSGLWKTESQVDPKTLPSPGAMLAEVTQGEVGGEAYDQAWPERAAKTLW